MKKIVIGALVIFAHGIALSNNSNALQKLQTNFNSFKGMGIRATNFDYMNYSVTKVDLLSGNQPIFAENKTINLSSENDIKTFKSIDSQEKKYINRMQKKVNQFTPNSYRLHKLGSIGLWAAATAGCLYGGSQLSDNNSWGSYSLWGLGALFGLKTLHKTSKCWNPKNRVDKLKANWSNSLQIYNTLLQYQLSSNVISIIINHSLPECIKSIVKEADQGNAKAQCCAGNMYSRGIGVGKDDNEAFKYFEKAAKQGNPVAQYNLGHLYEQGLGVFQDYTKAKEYFEKAAKQGHKSAQKKLKELEEK